MLRRSALPVLAATLGALLVLLAVLQYRWLGQVSDGERQRMRATLDARARDFATDFDREISRAAMAFSLPSAGAPSDPGAAYAERWDRWQASASNPRLVRSIYVVEWDKAAPRLRRLDAAARTLVDADWPDALRPARDRWTAESARAPGAPGPHVYIDDLADAPALVVPRQLSFLSDIPRARDVARSLTMEPPGSTTVVWFDLDEIRRSLLPALVKRYVSSEDVFDYRVSVVSRRDPAQVIFDSDRGAGGPPSRTAGDVAVPMFHLRLTDFVAPIGAPGSVAVATAGGGAGGTGASVTGGTRVSDAGAAAAAPATPGGSGATSDGRVAISVFRLAQSTSPGPARGGTVIALNDASGRWLLRLVHRAGSLDTAVARLRRRNLAVSSTILALLAVSMAFVLVSTRRAQRLAAQQVEFVASVSHELRTPLAVIRSAGENLADGVVAESGQVQRYGALIVEEGRKLGAMVEQVMEYAGMQSDEPRWRMEPVDLRAAVDEAVAGVRRLPEARTASIDVAVADRVPSIAADRAALVRAIRNLVENALKYGSAHGQPPWVRVDVRVGGDEARPHVSIEVTDRGPGVDPDERRRIFEPFVRGRAAAAAHVPGNGLGLSIVRRIAEGHGGHAEARTAGGGAVFVIQLPVRGRA